MESLYVSQRKLNPQLASLSRGLGSPGYRFSIFFLLPASEFVRKKSPVSRSWKPKVKVWAKTGKVFTLSCFLAHWMFIYFVQNQTSLPWRINNSESCSQYSSDQCFRSGTPPLCPSPPKLYSQP